MQHSATLRDDYSITFPQLSIARSSFIHLSELGHHGENEILKLRNSSIRDSNPGSLDRESGVLPRSNHAAALYLVISSQWFGADTRSARVA